MTPDPPVSGRVPRAPRRLGAATAALGLVASLLLGAWHEAEAVHVTCAEHGEQVHAGEAAARQAAASDPTAASALRPVPGSPGAPIVEHEHCSIQLGSQRAVLTAAPTLGIALIDVPSAPPTPTTGSLRVASLFRLAPKTSPPV